MLRRGIIQPLVACNWLLVAAASGDNGLPGNHSEREPPDPIPNSEVKLLSADGSTGPPRVRVGHCQAFNMKPLMFHIRGFFFSGSGHIYE